ncbi:hypothetical protein J6590_034335 [Homalodisca vitripennis]|nr:hypothetical protein J6590_034335 [Homalodisca vitripennis]
MRRNNRGAEAPVLMERAREETDQQQQMRRNNRGAEAPVLMERGDEAEKTK